MSDYEALDATAMAGLVRSGAVAPDHFINDAKNRVAALNPRLNAVVQEITPEIRSEGPFAGVPLLLKDTGVAVAGAPLCSGSRLFADVISSADSTFAARLRAAGFGFIGRTNTPELALSFTTEGSFYGPARNPWDPERSPGGSSGGAAAAVAARIVPVAQASDGAGSIRVPAAHCGVFGFKPSRLRNPHGPTVAEGIAGMATLHAITRSVRDSARLLDATHGPDLGDPWACPPPAGSFVAALERSPGRLRIGLDLRGDEDCIAGATAAARLLASLGHEVEPAVPDYDAEAVAHAWYVIAAVSCARSVRAFARARGIADPHALLEPVNAAWIREGAEITGEEYLGAVQALHASSRAMGRFFARYDIYLSPTTAGIAPPLGQLSDTGLSPGEFFERFWAHAPLTAVFNASGCPAMSLPLHRTAAGLPVGVQLGAAYGAEELLFSLARQLEEACPWAEFRPVPEGVK